MQLKLILFIVIILNGCFSCQKHADVPPPSANNTENTEGEELTTYVCYQTDQVIQIDGRLSENSWQHTSPTTNFMDIAGDTKPVPPFETQVKMMWDDTYFYIGARLEEPHIWANMTERESPLYQENAFEIFLDPDGNTHHYCEVEVNALNTVWDLLMLRPYREDKLPKVQRDWDIQGLQTAVYWEGTCNDPTDTDQYWTLEMAIPWKALQSIIPADYRPREGVQWRVNFARVNWPTTITNSTYTKQKDTNGKDLPADYWVWSPQFEINMHAPEHWGYVQFSETVVGQGIVPFQPSPDEAIKQALRELYYQQSSHFKRKRQYVTDLGVLIIPQVNVEGYLFEPTLSASDKKYEIVAKSISGSGYWKITEDGRIFLVNAE